MNLLAPLLPLLQWHVIARNAQDLQCPSLVQKKVHLSQTSSEHEVKHIESQDPQVELEFAPPHRHASSQNFKVRPEYVRNLRCNTVDGARVCEECDVLEEYREGHEHPNRCWGHANPPHTTADGLVLGWPSNDYEVYVSEAVVDCPIGTDELRIHVRIGDPVVNGTLQLLVDEVVVSGISNVLDNRFVTTVSGPGGHIVSLEFRPNEGYVQTTAQAVRLADFSIYVTEEFMTCEDHKACLEVFGIDYEEGSKYRLSNSLQHECLQSPIDTLDEDSICYKWRECLKRNPLNYSNIPDMEVAMATAQQSILPGCPSTSLSTFDTSRNDRHTQMSAMRSDDSECIDPEVSDVQSWHCSCAENWLAECEAISHMPGYTEEACLRAHYCSSESVCESWKLTSCLCGEMDALMAGLSGATSTPLPSSYDFVGAGAAGSNEVWNVGALPSAQGLGVEACYAAVMVEPSCAKDYFTYATRGDGNCGCKGLGSLAVRDDNSADYYKIQTYELVGIGAAGPNEMWNVGGLQSAQGLGVEACYAAVMAESSCAKDYFTYATRGDQNCGCKGSLGVLSVRNDGIADYFEIMNHDGVETALIENGASGQTSLSKRALYGERQNGHLDSLQETDNEGRSLLHGNRKSESIRRLENLDGTIQDMKSCG